MKDLNAVAKNRGKIEKLGWWVEQSGYAWDFNIFTPCGDLKVLSLNNSNLMDGLKQCAEEFDLDEFIHDEVLTLEEIDRRPAYRNLVSDAKWFHKKVCELYDTLKEIPAFDALKLETEETADDSREESKGTDK